MPGGLALDQVLRGPDAREGGTQSQRRGSLIGTIALNRRLYQRDDRLPNVLGKVGPRGHDGG